MKINDEFRKMLNSKLYTCSGCGKDIKVKDYRSTDGNGWFCKKCSCEKWGKNYGNSYITNEKGYERPVGLGRAMSERTMVCSP